MAPGGSTNPGGMAIHQNGVNDDNLDTPTLSILLQAIRNFEKYKLRLQFKRNFQWKDLGDTF